MGRPLLCNTCVGVEDDGRFWTRDQNDARWIFFPQPASPGLWSAYSDQYAPTDVQLGPLPYDAVASAVREYADKFGTYKINPPRNTQASEWEIPFKTLPFTKTEGPPGPPAGWKIDPVPPPTTFPTPAAPPMAGPTVSSGVSEEPKSKTGAYIGLGIAGLAAVAFMTGALDDII